MDRRVFLTGLAASVASFLAACVTPPRPLATTLPAEPITGALSPLPAATPRPVLLPFDPNTPKFPLPKGPITGLPTSNNMMAWTVDDGFGAETVMKYAEFARDSGARITFFVCAGAPGWTEAANILNPLISSGQVQIANHTYTHADLTSLSDSQIQETLMQNHDLIKQMYGVDPRPFYRPPFGRRDSRTDAAAAAIGYTVPVMWYGSLSDSGEIAPDQLLEFANKWFLPEHIVIGHANFPAVTTVFPQLVELLNNRNLVTVTLNDIYEKNA